MNKDLSRFWPAIASTMGAILIPCISFGVAVIGMSIPPNTHGIDVAAGRDLFRAHCGACHFAKVGFPAHHGPNLHEIGRTGSSRRRQLTAAEYILESIIDPAAFVAPGSRPGMPNNIAAELPPQDIRNIIGFLASRGASPDFAHISRMPVPDRRTPATDTLAVDREQMMRAQQVLHEKGKCLDCHALHSSPHDRILAPAIFGVGLTDRTRVHESLVRPDREIKPQFRCVTMELQGGRTLSGLLIMQETDHVVLAHRDTDGRIETRRVSMSDVESENGSLQIHDAPFSLMPTGYERLLTAEEIEAVEVLIHQLN